MKQRETPLRSAAFKKGPSAQDGLRKREDNIVTARKNKREENLNQRRRTHTGRDAILDRAGGAGGFSQPDFQTAVQQVMGSTSADAQLEGATYIQRLLSKENDPPIDNVATVPGLVKRFVSLLERDDAPKLQFECCWVLTNVASGTSKHTQLVVASGATQGLKRLLASSSADVVEQAVWALGNIAGDSPSTRDAVLQAGALPPLLHVLSQPSMAAVSGSQVNLARHTTWAVSNMCRGTPTPPHDLMLPAYAVLASLIQPTTDSEVLSDACWALSYLSDGPNDRIQAVVDTNVTRRLVDVLGSDRGVALVPALRIIGNVVTGDDTQTQVAINCGALQQLRKLLAHSHLHRPAIIKEACWALSNITAGTKEQVDAVIASGSVQELVRLLHQGCTDVKREALWAISNAASNTEPTQVAHLVQLGCLKPMVELLEHADSRIIMVALEGLRAILAAGELRCQTRDGEDNNYYALEVESVGGLDALEGLQGHAQEDVQEKAISILTAFYEVEAEENVVPQPLVIDAHGHFSFGAPADAGVAEA